jgi:Kef-type K+ transport system membrane component KefB
MFLVGTGLDFRALRGHGRTAFGVSQMSIVVPLVLGTLLAFGMFGSFAPPRVGRGPFVMFIAVSMSITAFPVLARILIDHGLYRTALGALAMACAAVDDVTGWCLLAAVVAVSASGSPLQAVTTALMAVGFLLGMLYVVRPLLARWAARAGRAGSENVVLVVLFSGLCLAALATGEIGVQDMFGAFLFGVVTPRGNAMVDRSTARMREFAVPVLLPLFFACTGLSTDVGLLGADPAKWAWTAALLAVAVVGKWSGGTGAARLAGQSWRDAMAIGTLMNCRGLTELVVLNVGLQLGVIGPELFTMLVLMALVTTAMTAPGLRWLRGNATSARPGGEPRDAAPELARNA